MVGLRRCSLAVTGAVGTAVPLLFLAAIEGGLTARFVKVALPLSLGLGLLGFGVWLVQEGVAPDVVWTTTAAAIAGTALFVVTSVWVTTVQQIGGGTVSGQLVGYLNTGWIGLGIATVAGYLYGRLQHQTIELQRQRSRLQQQNDRLDEFTSVVAHDLRNPLNVAQLRTELARESEEPTDHIDEVEKSLKRAEELISEMLALARQGQVIEERSALSIERVASEAWENVAGTEASLVVEQDVTVRGDGTRLEQAFENMFRNAVEHGGEDVTVRVGVWRRGFYVEDDGAGFANGDADRIMEMGYTTEESGTGYGLAIVEEIVDAHGWTIEPVEGAAGGARFEVAT